MWVRSPPGGLAKTYTERYNSIMSYKEDILRLRAEGKSYAEISQELGCSKGTVAYYLKEDNKETTVAEASPDFYNKVISYIDNFKEKRPCISCGSYFHKSQLDNHSGEAVEKIAKSVIDKETFEDAKRYISQLKFICANCDRLRKFKLEN
jgi:predicted transcriptional regulator